MGAEVDALGGDLVATPMQWAARNGYLYIIQLLIAHGADPTIKDSQGYNTLHLVTHSSSIMPLLYLLQQPISVDSIDAQGHTSLMWAAYQGDALSVDLLLKHGASVTARDEAGLTPLHWAVVRGNKLCIRHLVEKGADISAKELNGKTPRDMAGELKSLGAYKRALEEAGINEDGSRKKGLLSEVIVARIADLLDLKLTQFSAKHKSGHLCPTTHILLPHLHDAQCITMVHRYSGRRS
jgi:ankyrin repeat protein